MYLYFLTFLAAFLLSYLLTFLFKKIAPKVGAMDIPDKRKIHKKPVARLGGVAIFVALFSVAFLLLPIDRHFIGIFFGASILLIFGVLDDIFILKPSVKLVGQIAAALIIIASGIGINFITNPFGGVIRLDTFKIPIDVLGITYHITFWADMLTLFWILIVINAVNFLDGLDGLAAGVSGIAGIVLFFLALLLPVFQADAAMFSLILAGAAFGFLVLNFYPAKIFMGDSGSQFLGFIIAVLAIFSGGKIATALLLLGLPIIDLLWAVVRRLKAGVSPFKPDKNHLHHELLRMGFSQRKAVLLIYFFTAFFGVFAVLSNESFYKFLGIMLLAFLVIFFTVFMYFRNKKVSA